MKSKNKCAALQEHNDKCRKKRTVPWVKTQSTQLGEIVCTNGAPTRCSSGRPAVSPRDTGVHRGLTSTIHPVVLRDVMRLQALETMARLRVVRVVDIALACAPERPFKAALSAAQRAMKGLVDARYAGRHVTDRSQHIYGLTEAGARYLYERGIQATPSIKRVTAMVNPEHQLWINFLVLSCRARGLPSMTEKELLQHINEGVRKSSDVRQGLTSVGESKSRRWLRPDAVAFEPDGITWFEVDRSTRSSARLEHLMSLVKKIGTDLVTLKENIRGTSYLGNRLTRVVVFSRYDAIHHRNLARMRKMVAKANEQVLTPGNTRHFFEIEEGLFTVMACVNIDDNLPPADEVVGYVIFQMLPTWLPKFRQTKEQLPEGLGWFNENYLPYRRPCSMVEWPKPVCPLLR
jgi:hypothetical protein